MNSFLEVVVMGQVEHRAGFLFVVLAVLDDEWALAHPKYYHTSDGKIARISNPVDPDRRNNLPIDGAIPFGKRDYLIRAMDITTYYPCFSIDGMLSSGTKWSRRIRATTIKLIANIKQVLPGISIGITGSLATGRALDHYSDIDLLMSSEDYQRLCASSFWQDSKSLLHLRNHEEWKRFYVDYHILSALSADEFAKVSATKLQQFIYQSIPVNIFITNGATFLSILGSLTPSNDSGMVKLKGKVLVSHAISLPGFIILLSGNHAECVLNFHRIYQDSIHTGDHCIVQGFRSGLDSLTLLLYDQHCIWKPIEKTRRAIDNGT